MEVVLSGCVPTAFFPHVAFATTPHHPALVNSSLFPERSSADWLVAFLKSTQHLVVQTSYLLAFPEAPWRRCDKRVCMLCVRLFGRQQALNRAVVGTHSVYLSAQQFKFEPLRWVKDLIVGKRPIRRCTSIKFLLTHKQSWGGIHQSSSSGAADINISVLVCFWFVELRSLISLEAKHLF